MAVTARQISENIAYYIGRNKIINGKMEIAQRGTSFPTVSIGGLGLDRFKYRGGFNDYSTVQDTNAPPGFLYSMKFTGNSTAPADTASIIEQRIEGYNVVDLIGNTFVLSFWVKASKTGTYCVSFRNSTADRSYVLEYTISATNTWEYKSVTVPGGLITAGTWNWTNGIGLIVGFAYCGLQSSIATTAGSWQTGQYFYTSNQANVFDTVGGNFAITGVQLEPGATPTNFEHRPYAIELGLCHRYYYRESTNSTSTIAYSGALCVLTTAQARILISFPVPMRAIPTIFETGGAAGDFRIISGSASVLLSSVPGNTTQHSNKVGVVDLVVSSGLTVGWSGYLRSNSTNNTFLAWDAEL